MYCGRKTLGYLPDYDAAVKELLTQKFPDYELLEESEPPKKSKPQNLGDQETIY